MPAIALARGQPRASSLTVLVFALSTVSYSACDGGLAPPAANRNGAIEASIRYEGTWPPPDSVRDLRFVAMRFVPRDTSDFLELNRMAISPRLSYGATAETVLVSGIEPGVFVYSGIAVNYSASVFAWKPVAVYDDGDGVFQVEPQDTVRISIRVDFGEPPIFPPPL